MYKNSTKNIIYPLVLAAAVTVSIFLGSLLHPGRNNILQEQINQRISQESKIPYTLSLIENYYVDPVNLDSITEVIMPMLISELDPHSVYIPAQELALANEALDGEFDGIGVLFNMITDTAIVMNVIHGGPSEKAGIVNGDRIIRINDTLVAGQKIEQTRIVGMLRGKRGSKVNLSLERAGIPSAVPVTVTRGIVPIRSMTAAFMIAPRTAYIKLSTFSKNSHNEMGEALMRLRKEGMTKLIFDLRGNGGGFLDQAIKIANDFLPAGKLIVYTEDRNKRRAEEYSNGKGRFTDIELAILIDEGSASSSEILAGAIQDNDRGTVVGRRSFGKGLVQQQIPFSDGSAVRLTVARYYTPTGRSIQKPYTGGSEGSKEYRSDFINRYEHNELFTADSIKFDDNLKFTTPAGKTVYGGGGIMPDIFVPLDTADVSKYFIEVAGRNILLRYTMDYSDRHRDRINSIRNVEQLNGFLDSDTTLFDKFISYAAAHGVKPDREGIRQSRRLITAQLRAYIGRNTPLDDAGFYSNIYPVDNVITEAMRALDHPQGDDGVITSL